jgi:hypothetical protein
VRKYFSYIYWPIKNTGWVEPTTEAKAHSRKLRQACNWVKAHIILNVQFALTHHMMSGEPGITTPDAGHSTRFPLWHWKIRPGSQFIKASSEKKERSQPM